MAVKTPFSDEDMAAVLAGYPLGSFVAAEPLARGTVQTNYRVQTSEGQFIFRCYENRGLEMVRCECRLLAYLRGRGYPCPAPLADRRGNFAGLYQGKPCVFFEFVVGEHLEQPDADQLRQLVRKAAELHQLTQGYQPRGWRSRLNYSPQLCLRLAREKARRVGSGAAQEKLAWLEGECARLNLPAALPKGMCHCDFHFSNVLYAGGTFAALIDFDDANYTYLTFDLAGLVNPFIPAFDWDSWLHFSPEDELFDFSSGREILAEYARVRPLDPLEQDCFFDVYKLSILFDTVWYFERGAGDFYEKRKIAALNRLGRTAFKAGLF